MSNEWITDRLPMEEDCFGAQRVNGSNQVWVMHEGKVWACHYENVVLGCPWQPIVVQKPEPYVKPKRFEVVNDQRGWYISEISTGEVASSYFITRDAAEKVSSIFERGLL